MDFMRFRGGAYGQSIGDRATTTTAAAAAMR